MRLRLRPRLQVIVLLRILSLVSLPKFERDVTLAQGDKADELHSKTGATFLEGRPKISKIHSAELFPSSGRMKRRYGGQVPGETDEIAYKTVWPTLPPARLAVKLIAD